MRNQTDLEKIAANYAWKRHMERARLTMERMKKEKRKEREDRKMQVLSKPRRARKE